jgi:hypothetical protein
MYPVNRATSASLYPGRYIDADDDRAYVGALRILIGALNPVVPDRLSRHVRVPKRLGGLRAKPA